MIYKIIISPRAQTQIETITNYYFLISRDLVIKLDKSLEETYNYLKLNPYFYKRYKDFRAIPLKKFPYLLFYKIDEKQKNVVIFSCFHTAKNPRKYPK